MFWGLSKHTSYRNKHSADIVEDIHFYMTQKSATLCDRNDNDITRLIRGEILYEKI